MLHLLLQRIQQLLQRAKDKKTIELALSDKLRQTDAPPASSVHQAASERTREKAAICVSQGW